MSSNGEIIVNLIYGKYVFAYAGWGALFAKDLCTAGMKKKLLQNGRKTYAGNSIPDISPSID